MHTLSARANDRIKAIRSAPADAAERKKEREHLPVGLRLQLDQLQHDDVDERGSEKRGPKNPGNAKLV